VSGQFTITFAGVFAAEVLGDKLLYTTGALATRYRTVPMMGGIAVAFMAKMGVAVAVGQSLTALPPPLVAAVTAVSFYWIATPFWKDRPRVDAARRHSSSEAAVVSFASVVLMEWGDMGQLTAANLAVQLQSPLTVWVAAVSAMMAKAALAATVGARVRPWIERSASKRSVRFGGLTLVTLLGVLSVIEILNRRH
jgi:putative Ca2+/H+ antiporter (TMEM165/GDT1 family)